MKHLTCQCSRHCQDSAESTPTFRNSIQICRPLRTRDVLTRHAVSAVCCAHRLLSALWARPRDDASSVVGLDLSHAFLMDIFKQVHSLNRHRFLIFVVSHHSLQQLVCLVFRLAVRSCSSLFHASLRRASRPRWCSLSHGFRLRLRKGTTWLSLCVGINHQRRTVRVKLYFPVHST